MVVLSPATTAAGTAKRTNRRQDPTAIPAAPSELKH